VEPTTPGGAARALALPFRILEAISAGCARLSRWLLIGMSLVMVVVILLQVFLRYVVRASLPWSEELARYLMVWIGLAGASLALREGRHVGVTLLVDRTRGMLRRLLTGVALVVVFWFLWLMLSEGVRLLGYIWLQRSPAMDLPMVIPYAAIPVGALFMMVEALLALIRLFQRADARQEV